MFAPTDDSAGSTSEELDESLSVLHSADWPSVDAEVVDALSLVFDGPAGPPHFHQPLGDTRRHHGTRHAVLPAPEGVPMDVPRNSMDEIGIHGAANMTPSQLKRARRSAIEKKSRQRRQGELKHMRADVKRLEKQYKQLLAAKKKQVIAVAAQVPVLPLEALETMAPPRTRDEIQQVTAQLTVIVQVLEDERSALQHLIREHDLFHKAVRASGYSDLGGGHVEIDPHGVPISSSFTAKFQKMSAAACYALVRESYEAICRFDRSGKYQSFGTSFMGWTDKRKFDEVTSALNYGFSKRFPHEDAEVLFLRTWDMFRDEVRMAKMSFDSSVRMRFEVIQRINDDVYIIRRDHKHQGIAMTFLTVHILFRLQTPTGYTLCMRTVPSPEIKETLEEHEIYFDVFHWSHFNIMRDELGNPAGCECVTGGSIDDPSMMASQHWLFELMVSVLRWESACVSPLFLAL